MMKTNIGSQLKDANWLTKRRLKGPILPKVLGGHQKKPQNFEYAAPCYRISCKSFLLHTATNPIWPFPRNKASQDASHWVWLLLPLGCVTPNLSQPSDYILSHIWVHSGRHTRTPTDSTLSLANALLWSQLKGLIYYILSNESKIKEQKFNVSCFLCELLYVSLLC